MSWVLFYLLVLVYPAAFVLIGIYGRGWWRIPIWGILIVPAVLYYRSYLEVKDRHFEMCAEIAGLKVIQQPERVDRVRLVSERYASSVKGLLQSYYPRLLIIEASINSKDGTNAELYVRYTASLNPKAGQAKDTFPWKELPMLISESVLDKPTTGLYEVTVRESAIANGSVVETSLTKDGKAYAVHRTVVHWWSGIQYPDAIPTWRCPDTNKPISTESNPTAGVIYPKFSVNQILDLITN